MLECFRCGEFLDGEPDGCRDVLCPMIPWPGDEDFDEEPEDRSDEWRDRKMEDEFNES